MIKSKTQWLTDLACMVLLARDEATVQRKHLHFELSFESDEGLEDMIRDAMDLASMSFHETSRDHGSYSLALHLQALKE